MRLNLWYKRLLFIFALLFAVNGYAQEVITEYNNETIAVLNEELRKNRRDIENAIVPAGTVVAYGGSSAPYSWLLCNGQAVSRESYADLFAAIGTTYGVGDGSSTFNVPNIKGKVIVGYNSTQTEFDALAETGGSTEVTLTAAQSGLVNHHHHTYSGSAGNTNNNFIETPYGTENNDGGVGGATTDAGGTDATEAHANLQPYIVLNYIIKY